METTRLPRQATTGLLTAAEVAALTGLSEKTLANQRSCPTCRTGVSCGRHYVWVKMVGRLGSAGRVGYPAEQFRDMGTPEALAARTRGGGRTGGRLKAPARSRVRS